MCWTCLCDLLLVMLTFSLSFSSVVQWVMWWGSMEGSGRQFDSQVCPILQSDTGEVHGEVSHAHVVCRNDRLRLHVKYPCKHFLLFDRYQVHETAREIVDRSGVPQTTRIDSDYVHGSVSTEYICMYMQAESVDDRIWVHGCCVLLSCAGLNCRSTAKRTK